MLLFVLVLFKRVFAKLYSKTVAKIEKWLVPVIDEAIKKSAEYLNSKTGQEKMDLAVSFVQNKSKEMPWYLQIIFNRFDKAWLVDTIEKAYQIYKINMDSKLTEEDIDVKGNEVKKK